MAEDLGRTIPEHVQENYRERVETEYDGDWLKFARQQEAYGYEDVARWAAAQAKQTSKRENTADKAPRTKR